MQRKLSQVVVFSVLVAVIALGVPTAGAQGNQPRTVPVTGVFQGAPVNVMQRTCEGEDGGLYLELQGQWAGTITSSDPRLTGILEFAAHQALVDLVTGLGTFRGVFTVRDATTNRQTARGEFYTVVTEGNLNHGFAIGKVMNQAGGPSDDFFGNLESTLDASLNVIGKFGDVGQPRDPAVIQGGQCSGRATRVP